MNLLLCLCIALKKACEFPFMFVYRSKESTHEWTFDCPEP